MCIRDRGSESLDRFDRVELGADGTAEDVDATPAHGPQSEAELVVRYRRPSIGHAGISIHVLVLAALFSTCLLYTSRCV